MIVEVKSSGFELDQYLIYLVQDVTKQNSVAILGFFYDLGKSVGEMGVKGMAEQGTSSMRKEIRDLFPGTAIPFNMRVTGHRVNSILDKELFQGNYYIDVGFPEVKSRMDFSNLGDKIFEHEVLNGEGLPPFEKPQPKCSKMYKKLMQEIRAKRMV